MAEPFEARDEQAGSAARPKARVDFVQTARARLNRQKVNEPLHEAAEEAFVLERRHAVGLLLGAARVVQEDEIEVRAVAELEARELAVADDGEAGCARRRTASRRAVFRDELAPCGAQRVVEHELCRVGQPIADFHERQRPQPVGNADLENRRSLEHADRLEHRFDFPIRDTLRRALEQRCELFARWRRLEHTRIEQLVEQQRLLRDLAREPGASGDEREQPIERGRVLVQQREIRAAPARRRETPAARARNTSARPGSRRERRACAPWRPLIAAGRLRPCAGTDRRAVGPSAGRPHARRRPTECPRASPLRRPSATQPRAHPRPLRARSLPPPKRRAGIPFRRSPAGGLSARRTPSNSARAAHRRVARALPRQSGNS